MGCDIHLFVERIHPERGWVPVDPPRSHPEGYYAKPDGSRDYAKHDWGDWAVYLEPESDIQKLADVGRDLVDIVPSSANDWHFGRDYGAFGQLAGVRRDCDPFLPQRGVPDDISEQLVEYFYSDTTGRWKSGKPIEYGGQTRWGSPDLHSCHWYDLLELRQAVQERGARKIEPRIRELIKELEKIAKTYSLGPMDVRIVFGFDN